MASMDLAGTKKMFMISYPHPIVPKILFRYRTLGWSVVYDARDDWEEFSLVGQAAWYRSWAEKYIVKNSHKVSAVSWPLAKKLTRYRENDPVEVVPNALSPGFKQDDYSKERSDEIIVGYFGHLTDSWFDWDSMIKIAEARPSYIFEIIGHSEPENLKLPSNALLLGPKNHPEINRIASRWSAAIIPFKTGPLADAVDPIKIYEYLSLGLPTVSFSMPQIDNYPETKTVDGVEDFLHQLDWAVTREVEMDEIEKWLSENTW